MFSITGNLKMFPIIEVDLLSLKELNIDSLTILTPTHIIYEIFYLIPHIRYLIYHIKYLIFVK